MTKMHLLVIVALLGSAAAGKCPRGGWKCPSRWSASGGARSDAPDAKAFVAAHNIYRCMHNVPAVQWDSSVYAGARKWALRTGKTMQHSHGKRYRAYSDGENLAGTFAVSKHRGVDATHMWYSEIEKPCHYRPRCYQSFSAGHFTAMIWSSVTKIAYSDPTKELAVARYRGCDGKPPNFNNAYRSKVPRPKRNYAYCLRKVLRCSAFRGLRETDVDGCDGTSSSSANSKDSSGHWIWVTKMSYAKKCKDKYRNIARLEDALLPELYDAVASNASVVAATVVLVMLAFTVLGVRRFRQRRLVGSEEGVSMINIDSEGVE